jgi:RNA polymerase sigma factor (sigma-70 family)
VATARQVFSLGFLHSLWDSGSLIGLTDGQLLERFAAGGKDHSELAFAALVDRHGPLVLRTCRAIVRNEHDAEDAFQATFLILARKGGTLWVRDSVAPWLHRVARRAGLRALRAAQRRRAVEIAAAETARFSRTVATRDELEGALHREIDRLPDRYRLPLLLCDLQGRTYEEAARHLGCPVGTVKSRLARARERLRSRLVRRGLAPAMIGPCAPLDVSAGSVVPAALAQSTIDAAVNATVSAGVSSLALATMKSMLLT